MFSQKALAGPWLASRSWLSRWVFALELQQSPCGRWGWRQGFLKPRAHTPGASIIEGVPTHTKKTALPSSLRHERCEHGRRRRQGIKDKVQQQLIKAKTLTDLSKVLQKPGCSSNFLSPRVVPWRWFVTRDLVIIRL